MENDDERQKKLDAGRAKLKSFQKKKCSKKKKKAATSSQSSNSRDSSQSEEPTSDISTTSRTVSTNNCGTISDEIDTDHSSTTAEDLYLSQDGHYQYEPSAEVYASVEKWKRMTEENICLKEKVKTQERKTRDLELSIGKLRSNALQTAEQYEHSEKIIKEKLEEKELRLKENLQQLTDASEALENSEKERRRLEERVEQFSLELNQQKETVAHRANQCQLLTQELESIEKTLHENNSANHLHSSTDHSMAIARKDEELDRLKKTMEEAKLTFERRLQEEQVKYQELQHNKSMSDEVNTVFQKSSSKQLTKLENENTSLLAQLEAICSDLEQLKSYQELTKTLEADKETLERQLTEVRLSCQNLTNDNRSLKDQLCSLESANERLVSTESKLGAELDSMRQQLSEHQSTITQITGEKDAQSKQYEAAIAEHEASIKQERDRNSELLESAAQAKLSHAEDVKNLENNSSKELEQLRAEHQQAMDQLRKETERQLEDTRTSMESEQREQMSTVKDVTERSRDREIEDLSAKHKDEMEKLIRRHKDSLESQRNELNDVRAIAEERLRTELQDGFDAKLESELASLRHGLDRDADLARFELENKYKEEMREIDSKHEQEMGKIAQEHQEKVANLQENYQQLLQEKVEEAEEARVMTEEKLSQTDEQMEEIKSHFVKEQELLIAQHQAQVEELNTRLKQGTDSKEEELASLKSKFESLQEELEGKKKELVSLDSEMSAMRGKLEDDMSSMESKLRDEMAQISARLHTETEEKLALETKLKSQIDELNEQLATVQQNRDEQLAQSEESRRQLVAANEERVSELECLLKEMETNHEERCQSLQSELKSARSGNDDIQLMSEELRARDARIGDVERSCKDLEEERNRLMAKHAEELEGIKKSHKDEMGGLTVKMEQMFNDLKENKDKLQRMNMFSMQLIEASSSPIRPSSPSSEYDSSGVTALTKDFRSTLKLTRLADISGVSDDIVQSDDSSSSSSDSEGGEKKMRDESTPQKSLGSSLELSDVVKKEISVLYTRLEQATTEFTSMKQSRGRDVDDLTLKHGDELERMKSEYEESSRLAEVQFQNAEYFSDDDVSFDDIIAAERLKEGFDEQTATIRSEHQRLVAQIRLECASDTAKQVEEEMASFERKVREEFDSEFESLKHRLEREHDEKVKEERAQHAKELEKQADDLSESMEARIGAVLRELDDSHQETIRQLRVENEERYNEKLSKLQRDFEISNNEKEMLLQSAETRRKELEEQVDNLKVQLQESKKEREDLIDQLESGESSYIKEKEELHQTAVEELRKGLRSEFDIELKAELDKQAAMYSQEQDKFLAQHQQQLETFTGSHEEVTKRQEVEFNNRLQGVKSEVTAKYETDIKRLQESHDEELKAIATRLVEESEKKSDFQKEKEQLLLELQQISGQRDREIAELRSNLVKEHMAKFEEVTATLEEHHKKEMEQAVQEQRDEAERLREGLVTLQKQIDSLQEEQALELEQVISSNMSRESHVNEMTRLRDEYEKTLQDVKTRLSDEIKHLEGTHRSRIQSLEEDRLAQMSRVEEEVQMRVRTLEENQATKVKKLEEEYASKMEKMRSEYDELRETLSKNDDEKQQFLAKQVDELSSKIMEMNEELELAVELKNELDETTERKEQLEEIVQEYKNKQDELEAKLKAEEELREENIAELEKLREASTEEYQDALNRIEFERAEYEAEIDNAQAELSYKDENLKELQSELERKTLELKELKERSEKLSEGKEGDSGQIGEVDGSVREDLEKLREEKKQVSTSNERLMLVISQLVDYNNRCEQLITSRLADLPDDHGGKKKEKQGSSSSSSSSDDEEEKGKQQSGLVERMLDHDDSQQAVVDTGVRVSQSVDRLFNLLYTVLQQLNESQQAQSFLQEKLESLHSSEATMQKEKVSLDEECPSDVDDPMESLRRAKEIIVEKTSTIQQMKQALFISERNEREAQQKLENNEFALKNEMVRLQEEKALVALQKAAIGEGRDETEINLLQAVETLAHEKQTLKEEKEEERKRFLTNMQILEDAVDENQANTDKTEENYLAEIDDLKSQVDALKKHAESGSKYAEHLTDVCESERIEFENEKKNLQEQIDMAREAAREEFSQKMNLRESMALLSSSLEVQVKNLEEELVTRQQSYEKDYSALQTKIEEQEEQLNDCERQRKLAENEMKSLRDALSVNQDELGDVNQQREFLEKDLHSNLMRVAELEQVLDHYRVGIENQVNEGKAEAQERERMSMMQYKVDMQEKDNQISLLLEQQNDLRGIIVQNERRIDNLIAEVERLQSIDAHHSQLQEKMKEIVEKEEKTKPEDLHLLSEQLIEDKNAEIGELKREVAQLKQQGDRDQMVKSLQEKLENLREENDQLRTHHDTPLRHADLGQTIVTSSCQTDDVDTGISDVTTMSTPRGGAGETERENERLQRQLEETERKVRDLLQEEELSVIRFAPGTKEKIRDLEERLEKLKEDSSESGDEDEDNVHASLREIEAELKEANKNRILTRILQKKDDEIDILESEVTLLREELDSTRYQDLSGEEESQNLKISQMETLLQEKENEIAEIREKTLQDKDETMSTLQIDLKEAQDQIEKLQDELESRIEDDDVTMSSAADSSKPVDERLKVVEKRLQIVTRERQRGVQQLNDVQRECGALLEDNNKLEDDCRRLKAVNAEMKTFEAQWQVAVDMSRKHEELVKSAQAQSDKLVEENRHLQEEVTRLNDLLSEVEELQEENERLKLIENEKHQLQVEHARLSGKLESMDESKLEDQSRSHELSERLDLIEEDHSLLQDLDVRLQRLEAGNEEQLMLLDKYKEIVDDKPRLLALQKQIEELKTENRQRSESTSSKSSHVAQVELRIQQLESENARLADLFSKYDEAVFQDKQRYIEIKEAMGKMEEENSKQSNLSATTAEERSRLEQLESRIEQLEAKTSSADDVIDKLNELEEDERFAEELQDRLESLQQENERLSDFEEVNRKLEKENEKLVGMFDDKTEQGQRQRHLYELEKLSDELKVSLENARRDNEELKEEVSKVSEEYNETRVALDQVQSERDVLLKKLESLMQSHSMDAPQQQQKQQQRRSVAQTLREHLGSGDARSLASKTSTDDEEHLIINKDNELRRLADENKELRESIQNLTFRSEELEIENESMLELHAEEIDKLKKSIDEINNKPSSAIDEENKEGIAATIVNVPAVAAEVGDLKAKLESLEEQHRLEVEGMERDFNVKLEKAVKERDAQNDEQMKQMVAKYQQQLDDTSSIASEWELARKLREELEIAENIDSRLLQKMRTLPAVDSNNETADDESVMNATTNTNIDLDYASTDAETSNKIQRLFNRLHNEGIQVLSLSELQFLNQHSLDQRLLRPTSSEPVDDKTTSEQLAKSSSLDGCKNMSTLNLDEQSAQKPTSNDSVAEKKLDILRKSWENEKLALLESIEALKKLYTDTVINSSVGETPVPSRGESYTAQHQQLQWRDNLLRAVGDVFERERRALVAELQSSVIDAQEEQAESSADYPSRVAAKLEALERRVRSQDDLHRSEMERLITADRDELVADMRYMKADGDNKLKKLQSRLKEVQDHQRNKDDSHRQTVSSLNNQIRCLESRLKQLTALNDDLKSSLESEVKRTRDVHESLEKERERTALLANEILRLEQSAASDDSVAKREVQMLSKQKCQEIAVVGETSVAQIGGEELSTFTECNLLEKSEQCYSRIMRIETDAAKNILQQANKNLENVKQEGKRREDEIRMECDRMKKMHIEDEEKIAELEDAIMQNEKLRTLAISAIEDERTKTRMICEDLKHQREKAVERADKSETRCSDLENEVGAERRRCEELRSNLEAEAIAVKEIRQKIDRDRREVEEAREKDRMKIRRLELVIDDNKRERAQFDRHRDEFEEEKVIMLKKIERMREDVCKNLTSEKSRREQNVRAERELRDKIQEDLDRATLRLVNAERRIKELEGDLENERIDKDAEIKRAVSSSEMSHKENVEPLLLHRRQLENIRQRLHTETSRLQRMISYNTQQQSPSTDPTQLDDLKRTTQNLQQELRDLHTNLSLPKDFESEMSTSVRRFNDRVLRHNARLAEEVASCVAESVKLRDRLVEVEADNERLRVNDGVFTERQLTTANASKHKMAVRIHKLYFRYLRSESYRKALVYQKKYLLLLIGGFKDSEDATLALIAQMGAYPSDESLRRPMGRRSPAFTRFRSVVRVSIACSRMKFLVAKWGQASHNLSSCIESKHGVRVDPSNPPAATSSDQDVVGDFPYLGAVRGQSATPTFASRRSPLATSSTASSQRYPITPSSHHRHDDHRSRSSAAAPRAVTPSTGYSRLDDHLLGGAMATERMMMHSSLSGYQAANLPTSSYRPSSSIRSRDDDLEPPLKEYIRRLGNIQQKLSDTTTPATRDDDVIMV